MDHRRLFEIGEITLQNESKAKTDQNKDCHNSEILDLKRENKYCFTSESYPQISYISFVRSVVVTQIITDKSACMLIYTLL